MKVVISRSAYSALSEDMRIQLRFALWATRGAEKPEVLNLALKEFVDFNVFTLKITSATFPSLPELQARRIRQGKRRAMPSMANEKFVANVF